jgi:heptosyltransferase-2
MTVLLVRFSSLGDVVLSTAAVETLAAHGCGARIDVLTKEAFAPLFEGNPAVSEVLTLAPGGSLSALAAKIKARDYDWIIDLHATLRTAALKLLVRKPRWSVYRKDRVGRRLKALSHTRSAIRPPHVIDRYLGALTPLGISPERTMPKLYPTQADADRVDALLTEAGYDGQTPLIALAPGARWNTKAWPEPHWVELVNALSEEGRLIPVLTGGKDERELCGRIADQTAALDLTGLTGLLESAALLERSALLVSNDSAPLHIASAVGTAVLALFGPTVEDFGFYPVGALDRVLQLDIDCRPCHVHGSERCPKEHHRCLRDITPVEVAAEVRSMLAEGEG